MGAAGAGDNCTADKARGDARQSAAPQAQVTGRRASLLDGSQARAIGQLLQERCKARPVPSEHLHAGASDADAADRRIASLLVGFAAGCCVGPCALAVTRSGAHAEREIDQQPVGTHDAESIEVERR